MDLPRRVLSVSYPSSDDSDLVGIVSSDRKFLVFSDYMNLSCKKSEDLRFISAVRDPSDLAAGLSLQWPALKGYVRLYLNIAPLLEAADSEGHTIHCQAKLSLAPLSGPLQCDWVALVRKDAKDAFVFHRTLESSIRLAPGDGERAWDLHLTGREVAEARPLFLAIQVPAAAAHFQLRHFGMRLTAIESSRGAVSICLGRLLEGWARADDAELRIGTRDGQASGPPLPVGYGHFALPIEACSPPDAQQDASYALLTSGGDMIACLDLQSAFACADQSTAADPVTPAPSHREVESLYLRGKIELIWRLAETDLLPDLPESVRYGLSMYSARMSLALNASETAYVGLREALQATSALKGLPADVQRKTRLIFARACVRSGRPDEAEAALREMLSVDPFDWECYFHLAAIAGESDPEARRTYLRLAETVNQKLPNQALTVLIEDLLAQNRCDEAWVRGLAELKAREAQGLELWLTLANVHLTRGDRVNWAASVRRLFGGLGLVEPVFDVALDPMEDVFHRLTSQPIARVPKDQDALVTVIMTAFNAERTVKAAIRSVLDQTYRNLRLVVVDDNSTDDTLLLVRQMQAQDDRIEVLRTPFNVGTYCAKNIALTRFDSDYFTFHDSDDWMHPERIAIHLETMRSDPQIVCTTSRWYRMDHRGMAMVRMLGGYLHDNPASTFFHRDVVERIGYFDSVRTGADTELVERIRRRFGPSSVQVIAKPLAIGLHHSASLTRSGAMAFDERRFSAPRLAYWESWVNWHRRSIIKGDGGTDLYMPFPHFPRRFPAPEEVVPEQIEALARVLAPAPAPERPRARS